MQLIRTTVRIKKTVKKDVEKIAFEEDTTFQNLLNKALEELIVKKAKKKATIHFIPKHNLGVNLDNLTRDDIYGDPKF